MTRNIRLAIAQESKPPPADPIADGIFDTIDRDGDGFIQARELVTYMLKEYSGKVDLCYHSRDPLLPCLPQDVLAKAVAMTP